MTPIRIDSTETMTVTCQDGDFTETASTTSYPMTIPGVLNDAAMHAMEYGHTVDEHFARDGTVHPV
jgi:hypothetical protein